jgi:hypothetical protein
MSVQVYIGVIKRSTRAQKEGKYGLSISMNGGMEEGGERGGMLF